MPGHIVLTLMLWRNKVLEYHTAVAFEDFSEVMAWSIRRSGLKLALLHCVAPLPLA